MRFYEFAAALTPGPSPAVRERGVERRARRGEGYSAGRPSKEMREAARRLRREETKSEAILWQALRDRKLAGRKFRRQHPIGAFVLDFYCAEEQLAVEIDGRVHLRQVRADKERQSTLEALGIRFLRLPAALVERDLPAALARIEATLAPGPSPAVRERGGEPSASRGEGSPGRP